MIRYSGIKWIKNMAFLIFANEANQEIEVPIDLVTADRIAKYLERIGLPPTPMKRGDDESD